MQHAERFNYYYYVFISMVSPHVFFRPKTIEAKPIISSSIVFVGFFLHFSIFLCHQLRWFQCCWFFSLILCTRHWKYAIINNIFVVFFIRIVRSDTVSTTTAEPQDKFTRTTDSYSTKRNEQKKNILKSKVQRAKLSRSVSPQKLIRRKLRWQNKWSL